MRLLPKNSAWVKFERAQTRAKKPRAGRTTARLQMMLDRLDADIAARRDVSMEYFLRRSAAHRNSEVDAKRKKR